MRLILASRSPRRRAILAALGLRADIFPADIPEDPAGRTSGSPRLLVLQLAAKKAEAVMARLALEPQGHRCGGAVEGRDAGEVEADELRLVLAADTVVTLDGEILHTPSDADEARSMLRHLSGRAHDVLTGVCVSRVGERETWLHAERTTVRFAPLDDGLIERYVASGSPLDKAGAYGIQDNGAEFPLVEQIEGDYWNVVGLPVELLAAGLGHFGVDVDTRPLRGRTSLSGD
jgi:septum formation protein